MILTKDRYNEMIKWVTNNPNHEMVKKYNGLSPKVITRQLAILTLIEDLNNYEDNLG